MQFTVEETGWPEPHIPEGTAVELPNGIGHLVMAFRETDEDETYHGVLKKATVAAMNSLDEDDYDSEEWANVQKIIAWINDN